MPPWMMTQTFSWAESFNACQPFPNEEIFPVTQYKPAASCFLRQLVSPCPVTEE